MASLQNAQIDQSYPALIKTDDNGPIGAAYKQLTDGAGNTIPIEVSNSQVRILSDGIQITDVAQVNGLAINNVNTAFGGAVDFTAATVTGLPAGSAGLEVGTGTDSLQNAVGTASNASGAASIALGKNSTASGPQAMAYGEEALASATSTAAFGQYAEATSTYAIAFGRTSTATADGAVAFGQQTSAGQAGAVAMGRQVTSDTADTTHVRALKIVAPDGAALGGNGITFLSADGTAGVVTLLDSDELALDGVAIGGGDPVFSLARVGGINQASGCDVIMSSVLIPANTFQAGDMWQLTGADSASGSTGFVYSAYWISNTGTLGATPSEEMNLGQQETASAAWAKGYQKTLYVGTQDGTGIGTEIVCSGCSSDADGNFSGGAVTKSPDWTNDLYLVSRVCVDNSGATYVNHGATLRKIN